MKKSFEAGCGCEIEEVISCLLATNPLRGRQGSRLSRTFSYKRSWEYDLSEAG